MTDIDLDELRSELDGFAKPAKAEAGSAKDQRIIAGFEEIEHFVEEHGRQPEHGENNDIFERLYAVRLDRLRASPECCAVLKGRDPRGVLKVRNPAMAEEASSVVREDAADFRVSAMEDEDPSDEELLAALRGDNTSALDIKELRHVRSREEIRAAEEIAQRTPCLDFEFFAPVFKKVQADLESGGRTTVKFQENAEVTEDELFILHGQKVYVAKVGEKETNYYGRPDCRLRLIYDNGTEGDLLLRSFQRALYKDKTSRRITTPNHGPLFSQTEDEGDSHSGFIYVLRSRSDHPFISANREVIHKIGVTGGEVKRRIANAKKDPTFLLAEVEIIETYKLANIDRSRLERLLHRFLAPARLDFELKDRFDFGVEPQEWFLAPLPVIREVIERLMDGSIENCRYDPESAQIVASDPPPVRQ